MTRLSIVLGLVLSLLLGLAVWSGRQSRLELQEAQEAVLGLQGALAAQQKIQAVHSKAVSKVIIRKGESDAAIAKSLAGESDWANEPVPDSVSTALGL